MLELFGARASFAARDCANSAYADNRDDDYRFWLETLAEINARETARRDAAHSDWQRQGLMLI